MKSEKLFGEMHREIGARVRAARMSAGWSQEKLATALEITFQQVQKYEKGANRISAATLVFIAEQLGVSIGSLLPAGRADVAPSTVDDGLSIVHKIASMGPVGTDIVNLAAESPSQLRTAIRDVLRESLAARHGEMAG